MSNVVTLAAAAVAIATVGGATAGAAPAGAQSGGTIPVVIGSFTAERQCTLYAVTSGSEAAYSKRSGAGYAGWGGVGYAGSSTFAYARAWRTELVRDCVSNFTALRQSMEAAIAASGKFRVVRAGTPGAYALSGKLSGVGTSTTDVSSGDMSRESADAKISVQFTLKDPRGRIVHGNLITKSIETDNTSGGASTVAATSESGRTVYTQLQREVAFAVARSAAFKLVPLRVTEVNERRVRLNYGTPFLTRGATVFLEGEGGESIKGSVNMTGDGYAWVETRGTGDIGAVAVGSIANFAEADDPAANAPMYDRVELPF